MKSQQGKIPDVLVVGGGPAGMSAALAAAGAGAAALLLEKNSCLGRKMGIAGGGRCNLTNTAPAGEFIKNVPGNGKFLTGALSRFSGAELRDCLKALGITTKEEDAGRVFPASGRAGDVIGALERHLAAMGVKVRFASAAEELLTGGGRCQGVRTGDGAELISKTVIIATGGASFPGTGSTGDGYRLAARAGHTIVQPRPGLVPLCTAGDLAGRLQGLSVKDAHIMLAGGDGQKIASARGDFIFTHFGVSGPAALALSRSVSGVAGQGKGELHINIDFMPGLKEEDLAGRLWAMAREQPRKSAASLLKQVLPERLAGALMDMAGVDLQKKAGESGKGAWRAAAGLIKGFRMGIKGTRPLKEAMVTVGGVSTKEIDPRTMASRLLEGLYFAGEVIDVDAYTGGFNMQIAFSTGRLAGLSAAEKARGVRC